MTLSGKKALCTILLFALLNCIFAHYVQAQPTTLQATQSEVELDWRWDNSSPQRRVPETIVDPRGMVVSDTSVSTDIGVGVLRDGGNAVDAAVAVAFALAATYPPAGNIGGGGFMLIHPGPGEEPRFIDYRETAPAATHRETYRDREGNLGWKIVGTPGTVRGLWEAHKEHGRLGWEDIVGRSVAPAESFEIDYHLADSLNWILADKGTARFSEFQRAYRPPHGDTWKAGDKLRQPDLAKTLALIAKDGAAAFYEGPVADLIVREMQAGGGYITKADLAAYRAKWRRPIRTTYRGYEIIGAPPPSSGGTTLALMLNMLEPFDFQRDERWSPRTMHIMAEVMRRGFCERAKHLGDPDFVEIPDFLTSKEYAAGLSAQIDLSAATDSASLAGEIQIADGGPSTTHFSIVDPDGMAVSNTYTIESSYGSRVVVRGGGFLLNNEMGDFNWKPGTTDRTGRIGTEANTVAPGKRMLSSMTPTLVAKDGRVVIVTGSPGGRTIINTVLGVVTSLLDFDLDVRSAVTAPRMHHQWFPDRLLFEAAGSQLEPLKSACGRLRELGHDVYARSYPVHGSACTIVVERDASGAPVYHGVADPRRGGTARGVPHPAESGTN